jgi:hypothetical protein
VSSLRGEFRFNSAQRFFEPSLTLAMLISAVATSSLVVQNGAVLLNIGDNASFDSVQFPVKVKLPLVGPIQLALQGLRPHTTVIGIDRDPAWQAGDGKPHENLADACIRAAGLVLVEFYESWHPWITDNITSNVYAWPEPWNFARVVRNAIVHNRGKLHWDDPNPTKLPISWYGLTYSHSTNKRLIIGPDLNVADLVILLLEMNEALNRVECPQ